MDEQRQIMNRALELSETISQAVVHMEKQLAELRYEEAMGLLEDAVTGVESIRSSLMPLMDQFGENRFHALTRDLMEKIGKYLDLYKAKEHEKMKEQLTGGVAPAFRAWKEELETMTGPLFEN